MSADYSKELEVAIAAVAQASIVCRAVQSSISAEALEKKDRSPVTVADYASQAIVCRQLREAFPEDPIVAEEDAAELRLPENAEFVERALKELIASGVPASRDDMLHWIDTGNHDATASRYWTLDPIDGTKGFLRNDQYAISLALIVNGKIQVAALACPRLLARETQASAVGIIFSAIRGQGTRMVPIDQPHAKPREVRVSETSNPAQARMCESFESGHSAHDESAVIRDQLGISIEPVRMDSQAKYGVVARGEADIYLRLPTRADYEEKIWDHAGGVLVIEEAGGRTTDVDGKALDFSVGPTLKKNRGVVVTNGVLHDAVLQALARSRSKS